MFNIKNLLLLHIPIIFLACTGIERSGSFRNFYIECSETNDIKGDFHKPCNVSTYKTHPEQHWKSRILD